MTSLTFLLWRHCPLFYDTIAPFIPQETKSRSAATGRYQKKDATARVEVVLKKAAVDAQVSDVILERLVTS